MLFTPIEKLVASIKYLSNMLHLILTNFAAKSTFCPVCLSIHLNCAQIHLSSTKFSILREFFSKGTRFTLISSNM